MTLEELRARLRKDGLKSAVKDNKPNVLTTREHRDLRVLCEQELKALMSNPFMGMNSPPITGAGI